MKINVGCCGFPKAKAEYYLHFETVEIQRTFYQPPQLGTAQRWREEAPQGFEFTLKAWQLITHHPRSPTYRRLRMEIPEEDRDRYGFFRPTEEVFQAWEETKRIAQALRARIVVFQCPASFRPSDEHKDNIRAFFGEIDRGDLIFVWEPRGEWKDGEIEALCRELDLVHCVDPFKRWPVYGDFAYFRLHGITDYRYEYTDEDLYKLLEWCRQFNEVYCFFNNVSMWESASEFRQLVDSRSGRPSRP
jgi:uncharacterized protein YecE (DUF72 family)